MTSSPEHSGRPGIAARTMIFFVRLYQATLSHLLGGHCRFHPTCSRYAVTALTHHGAWRGGWLTLRRLLRCHPFGGAGYDPVPGIELDDDGADVNNEANESEQEDERQ